jgi:hypothetical protein
MPRLPPGFGQPAVVDGHAMKVRKSLRSLRRSPVDSFAERDRIVDMVIL